MFNVQRLYTLYSVNLTVLTVITHKLLLQIQLHKNTANSLYKYCTNCRVFNWTVLNYSDAAATCSAAQKHSTFNVQILYKLYSLQLNCTYSNYTDAVATCSVAQENNKFIVQVLYKVHNWSILTVTTLNLMPDAQLHNTTQIVQLIFSEVQCCRLFNIVRV